MIPFVGPSYQLSNRKADAQRTVNMFLKRIESGTGKSAACLQSIPGLVERFNRSADGEIRGFAAISGGRAFVVAGSAVYEIASDLSVLTGLATLTTSSGPVSIAIGREHLVVADGTDSPLYYEFAAASGFTVSDPSMYPTSCVTYIGGRFVFMRDGTDQFFWSAQDDPSSYDALDFATAESLPDGLVWLTAYREELWLFGTGSIEPWRVSSGADSAYERNEGVSIAIGCASGPTVQQIDNSLFFVGSDTNGGAVVYRIQGYSPTRVSTYAVEEQLQSSTGISGSSAWSHQIDGQAFYCVNAPGLETTWCFEVQGEWHERSEFVDGEFEPYRVTCHVYTNDRHLVGTEDGYIYEMDCDVYTNAGYIICRERISPHNATASLDRVFFSRFRLDCEVGMVTDSSDPQVELYYSNDGGRSWGASMPRSLGQVGETTKRVEWHRLGSGRDRVWRIRCTDNVKFSIVSADIKAEAGLS